MDIQILPVTAEMKDGVVDLHMSAFRGYANARLGRGYISRFIEWFSNQTDAIHLAAFSARDMRLLGYVVGAPEGYQKRMNAFLFPAVVRGALLNPTVLLSYSAWRKVCAKVWMLFKKSSDSSSAKMHTMRLVSMAVHPACVGLGVGRSLVNNFVSQATLRGFEAVELSVFQDNLSARVLYEKSGFVMKSEREDAVVSYRKEIISNLSSPTPFGVLDSEGVRIKKVYSRRQRDSISSRYSHFSESHLAMLQELERGILRLLRKNGADAKIDKLKVLDIGCGNGYFLRQMIQWGADPKNMYGVDILADRVDCAKRMSPASVTYVCANAESAGHANSFFDVVLFFTVFSSIMNEEVRKTIAAEALRVLRPDGYIIWYDFSYDNPFNADVKGVRRAELSEWFPDCVMDLTRITVAPPLARAVFSKSQFGYSLAGRIPFLCTHYLGTIRRK